MRPTHASTILIGTMRYRLSRIARGLVVLGTALGCHAAPPEGLPEPDVPGLSEAHREYLTRLARRTLRDALLGRQRYEPGYVPAALESLTAEVVVRLRQGGYLRSGGSAGPAPVVQATRNAALAAFEMMGKGLDLDLDLLNGLLLEIEVVGPVQPIKVDTDWTQWRGIDPFIEPGVHGMVLVGSRGQHRFCPTELFTSDLVLTEALRSLARNLHGDPSQILNTHLARFRTVHWYQKDSNAGIVSLHRGLTVVPPQAVTRHGLEDSIDRLVEYMTYRQLKSGLFTYQYQPADDTFSEDNNLVRQVGAVLAMADHASWSGRSASLAAADIGIHYHLQGLVDIPGADNAAYIATADGQNKLGVTALLALAMAEYPDAERYAAVREKLINGMLWLQRPSGMFITSFPPAERIDAQDYFPGEALLVMAAEYDHRPTAAVLEAFDRAIAFYRGYFRNRPSPAFVPWQVQAYVIIARHTKRQDYRKYVFELTDWLADKQLNESNCAWPELWGGIAAYQPGRAGVATAAYLEGFADALILAREVADTGRARRYEKVVRDAARFVMQLQVRPEEAYFIRSPQDAVGGIRTAPALNLLRIDHCQHALIGLIKARKTLFPDHG